MAASVQGGTSDSGTSSDSRNRKNPKRRSLEDDESDNGSRQRRNRKSSSRKKHRKHDDDDVRRKRSKKRKKRSRPRDSSSDDSSSSEGARSNHGSSKKVVNERLLVKLAARGETLEERQARRAQKRAAHITSKFGYTAEDNPFNDPSLHEAFTWKKRDEKVKASGVSSGKSDKKADNAFSEIEKVRRRRQEREQQFEEMQRIRAEESRMRELENYDEWHRKEEEFHLQQQRQRSAIRLVEGREKPIDVLAKNMLLFGLSDEEKKSRVTVKYQERYDAFQALENLEAELEEPQALLAQLKLTELQELLGEINAFCVLEREASSDNSDSEGHNVVLQYWNALRAVTEDEILLLKSGGAGGAHAKMVNEVAKILRGQSKSDLLQMKAEIEQKLRDFQFHGGRMPDGTAFDADYWRRVLQQLVVQFAKTDLSNLHGKMLVRQLERLERRKEELAELPPKPPPSDSASEEPSRDVIDANVGDNIERNPAMPDNMDIGFGDLEEELGLNSEVDVRTSKISQWEDKYRPRKPRYFNRVKTGYDWNKYNQTHYDHDNPPPKIVQGYKFNIFYPDLVDPTKTPQYTVEQADTDEFCIIRFHAGAPYEDVAFKIINREWNRSRKRGFKNVFDRGVLSLYFNFKTHWYRR